jgi:hypothetical protein
MQTRTYMILFSGNRVETQRYTENEANEVFGPVAVELMRRGEKAIVHSKRELNYLAIDLEAAGLAKLGLPLDTPVHQ